MKVSELHEKESKEKKPKLFVTNGMRVSKSHDAAKEQKPKTKKRKLSTGLSKFESGEKKTKKHKSRIEKSDKKKPTEKKNLRELSEEGLSEEELKERELILGGTVVAYDRDDPNRCFLREPLKSLVNLAIDFYNKNNSKEYSMVYLVRAIYESCQGALYYMTMTAKLPNQDDADAITFEAQVYQGIPETDIEIGFVRVLDAPPLSHVST